MSDVAQNGFLSLLKEKLPALQLHSEDFCATLVKV